MPALDLSDLLLDPDLAGECFTVLRRQQVLNTHGRSTPVTTTIPNQVGSIIPQADSPMVRGPDQQNLPRLLQVITQFRLRGISKASGNEFSPDVILWNNDPYVVNKVYDYSHYGAGFISADCSSIVSVEAPPQ